MHRHQEPVATDYVFTDVPAIDDGSMGAQIFVGTESEACDAQGLESPKQFVNSLEDNIQKRGAMDKLVSDRAQTEIGKREIFVGTESEACDAQGLESPKQFVNSLGDNIQKRGAMDKLVSDRAQTEIGKRVHDILRQCPK